MSDIRKLDPEQLWSFFHDITQIPHPSKKETNDERPNNFPAE